MRRCVPQEGVMTSDAHNQHKTLDRLVDDYSRTGMSRRRFLQGAMAAGLTAAGASALLAACDTGSSSSGGNHGNVLVVLLGVNTAGIAGPDGEEFQQIMDGIPTPTIPHAG